MDNDDIDNLDIILCRELKLRHVKLVREKKEMMASVSITATINGITATINGPYI